MANTNKRETYSVWIEGDDVVMTYGSNRFTFPRDCLPGMMRMLKEEGQRPTHPSIKA